MRSFATLGLIGAAALAAASDVHVLKQDTFKAFVESNDLVLAEFYAPWCGHCKALAPEYEEAATTLKEKNIPLAKIDCTEEADLCKDHGVEGYPTLKVFRGPTNPAVYPGQRKAQAIISYMTKQSLPAVSAVTKDTLEEFSASDKVVVVGYFAADDKTSNTTFTKVAETLRDSYLFGASSDAELAKKEGVTVPGFVLYKTFDEGKNVFSGKFEDAEITKFISASATPLVGEVGPETYAGYMESGIPLLYIFAEEASERESLAKELKDVAEKFKGKVSFATIDAKSFGQHAGNLNLEVGKWPAVAIQEIAKNQKFPFSQEEKVNAKNIEKFVNDFVSGAIEPSIKSEPIPESNDGPVTVIVAKNYDEIVLDDDKDVLVEFYAPWCGHCKALAPKYEELGALYGKKDKIVIAKVDATANDVPDEIQGFPTIKLFPAGKKKAPVDYQGSRTVEDLAEFIRDHGTYGVDGLKNKKSAVDDEDIAKATEGMPQQAMAASEKAKDSAESATEKAKETAEAATESAKTGAAKVAEKAKDAAEAVVEALTDDEGGQADHDEL
ncbi:disulfide-isomerase [Myriangium duriaei CBS 260.36]|uniref:Protein disulfide-isomerase n=1 Tax=Myriangium duriaei CBS 260.36 TaxID=1168546 RepID=A0A9P4J5D2_9PEZI|nr:disulfide-isomerase [Myriangium duriaei CBS 260.36]